MAKKNNPITPPKADDVLVTGDKKVAGQVTPPSFDDVFAKDAKSSSMGNLYLGTDTQSYAKYINDIKPLEDIDKQRAMNQSWYQQAGYAGAQMVGEIVGGTIEGLGSIPELFKSVSDEQQKQAADFDNWLIGFGRSIREGIADRTTIYRENPNQTFDVLDSGWWFSNMPSVVSSLSMMIPSMAVTRGLSFLGKLGRAGKLGRIGKAMGNMNAGVRYATKLGLGAAVSRNAENFREAYQVYDETYSEVMGALQDPERRETLYGTDTIAEAAEYYGTNNISDKQLAEYIASRSSWRSYKINSANIVFDALQFAPLLRGSKVATRSGFFGKSNKLLEANGRKLTKLGKFTRNVTNPVLYPIASQLTEGVEEAINFVGGEEGKVYGREMLGETQKPLSERVTNYLQDGHMWESAAWGVLGGVVFTGATNLISKDNGPQSQNAKLAEVQNRVATVAKITAAMEAVENSNEDPQTKAIKLRNLKQNAGFLLGRNAARAGNVDLMLEQLEDPKFHDQLVEGGFTTKEELQQDIELIKRNVLEAESLYKKHSGRFFYSETTGAARRVLENRGMELDQESSLNKKRLKDAETAVRNLQGGLNLTDAQKAALENQALKDTIAVLDTLANDALAQKDQDSANMYRSMQRTLEAELSDDAGPLPSNVPNTLKESLMQEKMYKAYDSHLTSEQNDLDTKERQKQYQEATQQEVKRQREAEKKGKINQIKQKQTVDTQLISYANSKSQPKEVVDAAKARIAELEAAENKPAAEKRADNYEGPKPKAGQKEGGVRKGQAPAGPEPQRGAGFMEKGVSPVRKSEVPQGVEPEIPADKEGITDPPATAEAEKSQGSRIPGSILFEKKTEEGPESVAHRAVGQQEMDLYSLGIALNKRLNLTKVGNKLRAKNGLVELTPEESAAMEALFDLKAGDELIFTPEGNYTTQDGVVITSLDIDGLEARYNESVKNDKPADQIAKDKSRLDEARALMQTAQEKGNLVIKVTDISNGAIVNTVEAQNLNNLKEHIQRNGLATAEKGVLTTTKGEVIVAPNTRDGAIYVIVDGPKSQIPVPLQPTKLSEVEGVTQFIESKIQEIAELAQADPNLRPDDVRVVEIMKQIGKYTNVARNSGLRLQRVNDVISIVVDEKVIKDPQTKEEYSETIEYVIGGPVKAHQLFAYNNKTKTRRALNNKNGTTTLQDVLDNRLLDINKEMLKENGPMSTPNQSYDNYLDFVVENFKTNVGGFLSTSGRIIPLSPVSTSPGETFGISVQFELSGTAVVKPTLEERVEAVRPEAKKRKKATKTKAQKQADQVVEVLNDSSLSIEQKVQKLADAGRLVTFNGNGMVNAMNNRNALYIKIDGVVIPFYRSLEGTDDKTAGVWYPFYFPTQTWLAKAGPTNYKSGYGNPIIKRIGEALTENFSYETPMSVFDIDGIQAIQAVFPELSDKDAYELFLGNKGEIGQGMIRVIESWNKGLGGVKLPGMIKNMQTSKARVKAIEGKPNGFGGVFTKEDVKKEQALYDDIIDRVRAINASRSKATPAAPNPEVELDMSEEMDDLSGLMLKKDGTVTDYSRQEDLDAAEAWFKSVFPEVPFIRVKGLIDNGGQLAYGLFADAAVRVSDMAIQGTAYHEAFHVAMHMYLTEEQRNKIYAEARKEYGDLKDSTLEELLAEKFRAYMITGESEVHTPKTLIGRWFAKLKKLVKMFVSKPNHTERLFRDIKGGKFNYKPTQQMINHAKRFKLNLAVDNMTTLETRQAANILSGFMHGAVESIRKNHDVYKAKLEKAGIEPTIENMVRLGLRTQLKKMHDSGYYRTDNIARVLQQETFEGTELSPGVFSRALDMYQSRFGIDLRTATINSLDRLNQQSIEEDADTEVSNEESQDGTLIRQYGSSLVFFNGKDTVSAKVRNAVQTTKRLSKFDATEFTKGEPDIHAAQEGVELDTGNFLGTPTFIEFDAVYPYLESNLAGISSTQEMMERLLEFAQTADPSYGHLYMKLFNDPDLQSAFFTHFAKQRPTIVLPIYQEDGSFAVLPINRNNSEFLIRDRFLAQAGARILEGSNTVPVSDIIGKLSTKMDNAQFAREFERGMAAMDMDLYENGVNVLGQAIRRELDKGTLTKEELVKTLSRLATAFVNGSLTDKNTTDSKTGERGNLERLGKSIRYYKASAIQNVVQNVEGKNIYGVTHGTFMSDFFSLLQNPARQEEARAILTQMVNDPKMKRSNYMRLMIEFDGKSPVYKDGMVVLNKEGIKKLDYALLDGLKNESSYGGVKYSNMTKGEYLAMSLGMFVNGGSKNNTSRISTPGITPSDKSTLYILQSPRWESTAEFADNSGGINTNTLIGRLVIGELQAMRQEAERIFVNPNASTLQLKDGVALQKFANPAAGTKEITRENAGSFFKSQLGSFITPENFPSLFEANGIVPLNKLDPVAIDAVIEKIKTDILAPESDLLMQEIEQLAESNEQVRALVNQQPGDTLQQKIANIVQSTGSRVGLALHHYLHNYEYQLFFHAPEAEFKSDVDSGKRAASATTPGISLDPMVMGETFRAVTLEDIVLEAAGYEQMVENLTDRFISEGMKPTDAKTKAESVLEPYKRIETTDAQGYMTLDRYEKIIRARGMWNPQYEKLFAKARAGKDMTVQELQVFMMPQKPLYYGREFNTDLNRMNSDLIKLSSMPLVPALTKGTPLDGLRKHMEENKIDEAFHTTAHKVGAQRIAKIHTEENGVIKFNPEGITEANVRQLSNKNYRIQLDTPEHLVDAKNKLGSQIAKLILADLSPTATYKKFGSAQNLNSTYQDAISELVEIEFENLMQDIGAVKEGDNYVLEDITKFEDLIQRELIDRNASRILRDSMKLENGRFVIPPFFSGASNKLEAIILSLFTNRITNIKVPGATAIQASSALLAKDGKRPSVVFNEEGGVDYYEVMLPAYMKKQMTDSEGNILPLEDIDPEALKMIGYRIPTEGKSSMAPMRVIGFLPNAMGSTIVVPDEFIVQMGSDFDIDKLFIQTKNVGQKLSRKKELQNTVFDVFESVLQNPAHLEEVLTPQGFEGLADVANAIGKDRGMTTEGLNTQLLSTQSEFRQRNQVGGQMIGIAANINVFSTVAQVTGMTLADDVAIDILYTDNVAEIKKRYPDNHKVVPGGVIVSHKHLGRDGNNGFLAADGTKISSNLKQFVGATVDNAKDPLFDKFNGNAYTVPTIMTMVAAGIPMEIALYFSAQESIVNLANAYSDSRGIFGEGSSYEFGKEKERILKEINKLSGTKFSTYEQDVDAVFNESGKARKPLSAQRLKNNLKVDYDSLTKEGKLDYLYDQLDLIDKFRMARKAGQAVQDGYTVFKTDVIGAGPNTSKSRRVLATIQRVHNYPEEGPRLMIGEKTAAEAIYPSQFNSKDKSAYPILESYLTKANIPSLEVASKFFLTETPAGQNVIDSILDQLTDGRWDDNIVRKAKNMINQYVLAEQFSLYDTEVLLGVNEDLGEGPVRSEITAARLRDGNLSVAEMVYHAKKKYPELANDEMHILNKLTPMLSQEQIADNEGLKLISFQSISDSVIDDSVAESLEEMLFSDDPFLSMLAEMLVVYNYKTKGMSFQRGSFSKILSPRVLKEFGIPEALYTAKNKADAGVPILGTTPGDLYASVNFRDFRRPTPRRGVKQLEDGSLVMSAKDSDKYGPYVFFGKKNNGRLYKKVTQEDGKVLFKPHPMYGIPGKLVEFDNSIIHKDTQVTESKTTPAQFSKLRQTVIEDSATTEEKINLLKDNFAKVGIQVEVLTDESMEENAKVEIINGQPVVTINPNKVFSDTVIHEFGHIYVDLLGIDNPLVRQGIEQLRGTELWSKVEKAYPELSGDQLAKEVLVTAIGREGAQLFNEERKQNRWKTWLNKFFRAVGKLFGVQPNAARQLASEMLANNMQRTFDGSLQSGVQFQKDIDNLGQFFDEKKLLLKRLIKKYGEDNTSGLVELVQNWREADHLAIATKIDQTVKGFVADANAYIAEMEKFFSNPDNRTKENLDNYYATLYNYRQALSAFDDIGLITKELSDDKKTKKALKKLQGRVASVNATVAKIDRIAKKNLAETLKEVTSNPELAEDMMKIFKGDGIIAMDESNIQLQLDALADTNVAFIALAIKDYKIAKAENDEEIRRRIGDWQDLMKQMKQDGVSMDSLLERNADGKPTGRFIMPTIGFKKSERPNPAYQRLSQQQKDYIKKLYDLTVELTEHTSNDLARKGYIPTIPLNEKNYWESVKKAARNTKSRFNKFKNKHKEETGIQEDDKDLEVIVDETGNVVSMLPLHYMRKLDQLQYETMPTVEEGMTVEQIAEVQAERAAVKKRNAEIRRKNEELHGAAVNTDLESTMERFIMTAMTHKFKKQQEGKMLLIREQLRNMDIVKNPKLVDRLRAAMFEGKPSPTVNGAETNIYDHYNKWLKMVFYDEFEADERETWKAISDGLRDYSSLVGIGLNVYSAVNNKTYGEMMISIEAAAGEFFTVKDWAQAKKEYNMNILAFTKDRDSKKTDNFHYGLIKRFDVLQSQAELSGKEYAKGSMAHGLMMAKNAMYFMQHIGEHSMQNQVLFAMLRKEKVMLDGKEVSMMDALELRDGYIEVKQGAQKKDGSPLTNRDLARFKTKVIAVNQYLHGIYNKEDAGTIQHYALGRLAMQFRKWARPGWNKRFGSKFGKSYWNERRESLDEGMYITAYNFGVELLRDALNLETNAKAHWNQLSEQQKANMRRTLTEVGYMITVAMLTGIARKMGEDDEDNKSIATLAYMLDRSRTELLTYTPIWGWFNEGKKLMNSPVASFRQIETMSKLLLHVGLYPFIDEEDRYYKGGMYYGQSKAGVWFKSMLPGVAIYQRWQFIERQAAYFKLYGF